MQIDSARPQALASSTSSDAAVKKSAPAANDVAGSQPDTSASAPAASQDDAVLISPAGAAASAQDLASSRDAARSDAAAGSADGADSAVEIAEKTDVSPVKSFAYGSLGLERPDQPQSDTNTSYTAGRWLAAGITVAGLVALLF